VLTGFWSFRYAENPAAAFGLFAGGSDQFRTASFLLVGVSACALFVYSLFKASAQLRLRMLALSLLIAGTIGNCIDRLHHPYVVDFIDWHYQEHYHWPTFNLADVAITVAVALLVWEAPKARRLRIAQKA
jgi:signal peptidase II